MKFAAMSGVTPVVKNDITYRFAVISVSDSKNDTTVDVWFYTTIFGPADRLATRLNGGESIESVFDNAVKNNRDVTSTFHAEMAYTRATQIQDVEIAFAPHDPFNFPAVPIAVRSYPSEGDLEIFSDHARWLVENMSNRDYFVRLRVMIDGEWQDRDIPY